MSTSHPLIKGTLILTFSSLITKIMGFFYKIFLSHAIGAKGLGIYQLVFPLYALMMTLAASGIQTAISRFCSASFSSRKPQKAWGYFLSGTIFSCSISIFLSFILYRYADVFSLYLIKEVQCASLLRIAAFSLPTATLHNCINSWYYAKKQTAIPAISHLLEQAVRILISWSLYQTLTAQHLSIDPSVAVLGMAAGEAAACIYSVLFFWLQNRKTFFFSLSMYQGCARELFALSAPLTMNRLILSALQSLESILIPQQLVLSGMSSPLALEVYGILTGMSIPFLLFPSSLTTSASTILLPVVAADQASGKQTTIQTTVEKTIQYCLMLGMFCTVFFFSCGEDLGNAVFHNDKAGEYLQTLAFLCPFFYLTGTLSTILTGLGKTGLCLLQNILGVAIRIACILFLVPHMGMSGYLWGLLLGQFIVTLLGIYFIQQQIPFTFSLFRGFVLPTAAAILSVSIGRIIYSCLLSLHLFPTVLLLVGILVFCSIAYLLLLIAMGLLIFSL